jgi:hypothetical protein
MSAASNPVTVSLNTTLKVIGLALIRLSCRLIDGHRQRSVDGLAETCAIVGGSEGVNASRQRIGGKRGF